MAGVLEFLQLTSFSWGDVLTIGTLVVLEGLLMCDNAVALAMLVRRLPREQQGKALRYGILGAYLFLFIALVLASWIVNQWYLKLLGGGYLLYVAISHFAWKGGAQSTSGHDYDRQHRPQRRILGLPPFWSTVLSVELTDLAFSVDSIAAAVALSGKLWVLMLGSMVAILCMRFAAQGFIRLLRHFPRLEVAAFVAVALIGLKLVAEIPLDVFGRVDALPPGLAYATSEEYEEAVDAHHRPLLDLRGLLVVNRGSLPPPEAARFPDPLEYAQARTAWQRHYRPAVHIDEWTASGALILIIASGFLGPRTKVPSSHLPPPDEVESPLDDAKRPAPPA